MNEEMNDKTYVVNKRIVADDFEDETVLINVEKGLYFSMQGSASEIWRAFEFPQLRSDAVAVLSQELSPAEGEEIARTVQSLIDHDLLIESEANRGDQTRLFSFAAGSFISPVLGVFSDLTELIAIDPVHEVDEGAGWPVRPASFPGTA